MYASLTLQLVWFTPLNAGELKVLEGTHGADSMELCGGKKKKKKKDSLPFIHVKRDQAFDDWWKPPKVKLVLNIFFLVPGMGLPSPHIRQNGTAPGAMTPSHNPGKLDRSTVNRNFCFIMTLGIKILEDTWKQEKNDIELLVSVFKW